MADTLLQDGSEVFRTAGGKSVQIGSSSHEDAHSMLLILRTSEGTIFAVIIKYQYTDYAQGDMGI